MYVTEIFEEYKSEVLKERVNSFLSKLDSDYQYVDLKFSSAGNSAGKTYMSAIIIMRYIPKRKVLFEKEKNVQN